MALKLCLLTSLALMAFAANSLLARAALLDGTMDGLIFTVIRIASGAMALGALVKLNRMSKRTAPAQDTGSWVGAVMLMLYAVMFSLAYLQLETGLGALCLFAVVQLTIMVCSARSGELYIIDIAGASVAMAGLTYLVWPNIGTPKLGGIMMMALSGVGWGLYTWLGRGKGDPLLLTYVNFVRASWLCVPVTAFIGFTYLTQGAVLWTQDGVIFASLSGALTSGVGYAIWYKVLPNLSAATSGISQLLVPPLAALMGWAVLGEGLTGRFWLATGVILAGLAMVQGRGWRMKT